MDQVLNNRLVYINFNGPNSIISISFLIGDVLSMLYWMVIFNRHVWKKNIFYFDCCFPYFLFKKNQQTDKQRGFVFHFYLKIYDSFYFSSCYFSVHKVVASFLYFIAIGSYYVIKFILKEFLWKWQKIKYDKGKKEFFYE